MFLDGHSLRHFGTVSTKESRSQLTKNHFSPERKILLLINQSLSLSLSKLLTFVTMLKRRVLPLALILCFKSSTLVRLFASFLIIMWRDITILTIVERSPSTCTVDTT